jgi:hypothetical protein
MPSVSWLIVVTVCCLSAAARGGSQAQRKELPAVDASPRWNYSSAAAVVRAPRPSACALDPARGIVVALHLLAWRTFEGSGRQDEALWWLSVVTSNGPEWVLAMTFRVTNEHGAQPWTFTPPRMRCARRLALYRRFSAAPDAQEAVELLGAAGPTLAALPGGMAAGDWFHPGIVPATRWSLRDAAVRAKAWRAAFGTSPPDAFQP